MSIGSAVPEAQLVSTERGLVPKGQGWFILNARETQWWKRQEMQSIDGEIVAETRVSILAVFPCLGLRIRRLS